MDSLDFMIHPQPTLRRCGGGGGKGSGAYGGDDDTNNTYRPNSTSGTNGYTTPTPVPNGSNGGVDPVVDLMEPERVWVVITLEVVVVLVVTVSHPTWSSTTFYKGGQSGINAPEPSGRQSGPFVNIPSPPSRIWIPQEPTIAGRGTKTINNEVPSSSKIFTGSGYAIPRYTKNPSASDFNTPAHQT